MLFSSLGASVFALAMIFVSPFTTAKSMEAADVRG
jgi:hypothetical protein